MTAIDINTLSPGAQALVSELQAAADFSTRLRPFGWAMIDEDRVGGLGEVPMPEDFFPDDEGAAEHAEALASFEANHPIRAAIRELREHGVDVIHSAGRRGLGDAGRIIQLRGVRLQGQAPKRA